MVFRDRRAAGTQLAQALHEYAQQPDSVVVGLPRGGMVVAAQVAQLLALPLDIIVVRKIGHDLNPEFAIGAIAETGTIVWDESERALIDAAYLKQAIAAERAEARRQLLTYRQGQPPRDFVGKTLILVDDGVATGLTMKAAVSAAHSLGAGYVIAASPHGAPGAIDELRSLADRVVVLELPDPYWSVGSWYTTFPQTSDAEVQQLLTAATEQRHVRSTE